MRLLLTSRGIRNESKTAVLGRLVQRPIREAKLVFVVTAAVAQAGNQDWLVEDINRVYGLGWNQFNVLEINGLPGRSRSSVPVQYREVRPEPGNSRGRGGPPAP